MKEYNAISVEAFDIDDPDALNHVELIVDDFVAISLTEYQARETMESIQKVLQERADNRTAKAIEDAAELEYEKIQKLTKHNGTAANVNAAMEGDDEL